MKQKNIDKQIQITIKRTVKFSNFKMKYNQILNFSWIFEVKGLY